MKKSAAFLFLAATLCGQSLTVAITNLTNVGSDATYFPGDHWRITLTGAPGAPLVITGIQDGVSHGSAGIGSLDPTGHLVLTGQMAISHIGAWVELFNGVPLTFTVALTPPVPALVVISTPITPATPNRFPCPSPRIPILVFGRSGVVGLSLWSGTDYTLVNDGLAEAVVFTVPEDSLQVGDVVQVVCQ